MYILICVQDIVRVGSIIQYSRLVNKYEFEYFKSDIMIFSEYIYIYYVGRVFGYFFTFNKCNGDLVTVKKTMVKFTLHYRNWKKDQYVYFF